ncbi:MAG TPA: hypothetical protein VKA92_02995 [Segetibacter sp.]|nr:hypothetical protein [Segetibacter sp.]
MVHYSFLSNRNVATLGLKQMQMGIIAQPKQKEKKEWKEIAKEKLHYDVDLCPCCKTGNMVTLFAFDANGPPAWVVTTWHKQQTERVVNR